MICIACSSTLPQDKSRCINCGKWNILDLPKDERKPIKLSDVKVNDERRLVTRPAFDICFGGGIVLDSVSLLAGQPGAGKSTFLLELADAVAEKYGPVLYIATEENESQIAERAKRLWLENMCAIYVVNAMGGLDLIQVVKSMNPKLVILDSLPGFTGSTIRSPEESIRIIQAFKHYAESRGCPAIVVDHITKDDDFAGFMALQHAVDTLLMMYVNSENKLYRRLETHKNRHGPVPAKVRFEMRGTGLEPTQT